MLDKMGPIQLKRLIREYLDAGRAMEAMVVAKKAIESFPPGIEFRLLLAESSEARGKTGQAIEQLEEALLLSPGHVEASAVLEKLQAGQVRTYRGGRHPAESPHEPSAEALRGSEVAPTGELAARLLSLRAALKETQKTLAAREAPLRVVLFAEEKEVTAMREEAAALRTRIEAYKAEVAALDAPPVQRVSQAPRVARVCLALTGFVAGVGSLPGTAPRVVAAAIAVVVGAVVWGVRRG